MYTGFPVIFLGLLYWVILTFFQRKDKIFIKIFGSLAGTCEAYRAYIKPAVKKKVKIWERFGKDLGKISRDSHTLHLPPTGMSSRNFPQCQERSFTMFNMILISSADSFFRVVMTYD